jgi:hypothetical protein
VNELGEEKMLHAVSSADAKTKTKLNKQQILGFWAAWAGWTLDGMDSVIYALVLAPALTELLPKSGIEATPGNIGFTGSILFALFLVGWGCSFIWGPIPPNRSPRRFWFTPSSPEPPPLLRTPGNWVFSVFSPGSASAENGRWPARMSPKPGPKIGAKWAPAISKQDITSGFS